MANTDVYVERGRTEVQERLRKAAQDVQKIGDEFQEVKDGISGMPGGMDDDIQSMIEDVREQGRSEAEADIEGVKSSAVADAKNAADSIRGDVSKKISDNEAAKSKLGGIRSKYGKSALDRAASAIDANTRKGSDLLKQLDDAMRDADREIQDVKDRL